jgi:Mg/Co/Ni transporter MgtE
VTAFLAALLLLAAPAGAQTLTTINENLATSTNTFLLDTNSPRLDIGTNTYTGGILGTFLFVSSNVVISTGTGVANYNVIYATGSISTLSLSVSSMTIGPISPPNGHALCLLAGHIGHCETTPTNGACSCVSP